MIQGSRFVGGFGKSSFSAASASCVELAPLAGGGVAVRDSKQDGAGPVLFFTAAEWAAFVAGMRAGEFDYLAA
jgi:hypothetical protein